MVIANSTASSWLQRNPGRSRLSIRERTRRLDNAARQLQRAKVKVRHTDLLHDLKMLAEEHDTRLNEIAGRHSRKVPYLRKLMNTSLALKRTRKPNLMNAIVHHKAQELKRGMLFFLLSAI